MLQAILIQRSASSHTFSDVDFARLQQQVADLTNQFSSFSILASLIAIGFGALLTTIIIFFALRTEKASIAVVKDELRGSREEIETLLGETKAASASTALLIQEIEMIRSKAAESSIKIEQDAEQIAGIVRKASLPLDEKGGSSDLSPAEQKTLGDAALKLEEKALRDLSAKEFNILKAEAKSRRDWFRLKDLADAYIANFQDEMGVAESKADRVLALDLLGFDDDALSESREFISRYAGNELMDALMSRIQFNRGINLKKNSEFDEAIGAYTAAIDLYRKDPKSRSKRVFGSRSLCNRGNIYVDKKQFSDAERDFLDVLAIKDIDKLDALQESAIRTRLSLFRLAKAQGSPLDAKKHLQDILRFHEEKCAPELSSAIDSARRYMAEIETFREKASALKPQLDKTKQSRVSSPSRSTTKSQANRSTKPSRKTPKQS